MQLPPEPQRFYTIFVPTYVVELPKNCEHTLMCGTGGVTLWVKVIKSVAALNKSWFCSIQSGFRAKLNIKLKIEWRPVEKSFKIKALFKSCHFRCCLLSSNENSEIMRNDLIEFVYSAPTGIANLWLTSHKMRQKYSLDQTVRISHKDRKQLWFCRWF